MAFQPPPVFQSFRWTAHGGLQPLVPPGTTQSLAQGINSAGAIVGSFGDGGPGMYYLPPGPAQTIANAGVANAINDHGVMAGRVPEAGVTLHGYRYDGVNPPQDLGVIGGTESYGHDINDAGTVVGWSNINSTAWRVASRYVGPAGPMQIIPGLSTFADSEARAINDSGDIVGFVSGGGAFRFTADGTLVPLPGTSGRAFDINDAGFVVGSHGTVVQFAALWRPDNTLVDLDQWLNLNDPIEGAKWTLINGLGINNNGLIAGVGQYNDGVGGLSDGQRAYVLDASTLLPEPAAIAATLAVFPLLLRRRR